jgi:hypothetical protein
MPSTVLVDIAGWRRSSATLPAFHAGRPPHNKGLRYPADPPTVEEIIAVMHAAGDDAEGLRLRGLIVVLWRAGLRVSEALALAEGDLDPTRGAILVRHGKGGKRREVGMDRWAWEELAPWLTLRATLPVGAPAGALDVQLPPVVEQQLMRAAIPPPRPLPGDRAQPRAQPRLIPGHDRLVTVRGAMLTDIPARPPLRQPETVLEHPDRLAPTLRAHQFPRSTSRSAATSNV